MSLRQTAQFHKLTEVKSLHLPLWEGHQLSIRAMIRSAIAIASAMADSSAGEGRPSQLTSFLAAKMLAAISNTRLRPSSTPISVACSLYIRHNDILN
jgi:hypothetical protein